MPEIWFWQRIITPHMMGLAVALADLGVKVTYVAQERISVERKRQGWSEPKAGDVQIQLADNEASVRQLVAEAPIDSVQICQGIRSNGLVGIAQRAALERDLTQWVVMETVRDVGWLGVIKRFEYARLFRKWGHGITGVLATGHLTPEWIIRRGVPSDKVFPFAYFLEEEILADPVESSSSRFKFIFVGQFIQLKRLDWLISALGELGDEEFELIVIGSGPLESSLQKQAMRSLGEKVTWIGRLPSHEVRSKIGDADCLVLPSLYDGWGAVVSEALISGTPVICSDSCGSAGIVNKSQMGGVFREQDIRELQRLLGEALSAGPVTKQQRHTIRQWGKSLTAEAGAKYLLSVLEYTVNEKNKPHAPWD